MSTALESFSNDAPVPTATLTELFFEGIDRFPERAAFQRFVTADDLVDVRYREVLDAVRDVSAALAARGVRRGDRVAILSENRLEWALADYGCLCLGAIVVPIYATQTTPQVAYILEDSGTRLVFASSALQCEKLLEAANACEQAFDIVGFDPDCPEGVTGWDAFVSAGAEARGDESVGAFRAEALSAAPEDVATIIYTSGTTGQPKGVMLTHNNVASNVRAATMYLEIGSADNTVSFLPLSHILQRMVDFLFFLNGCTIAHPRSLDTLLVDLRRARPTVVVSVPRIYEKIYNGVMSGSGPKKKLVDWAVAVADRAAEVRLAGGEPRGWLAVRYWIADRLVFSKVKKAVGGRLRFFVSGGGPLAPALNRFFYSIGMLIYEGYGLTETSPVTNVNNHDFFRIGTVGRPVPGTEIRIAQDGEILVRGPQVMLGYYNKPEATAEVMDSEGWFATGDIGEIDDDGFLSITDRKKDILITAGGKNVAPQPIENLVKTHPLVEQAVLIGERRRYCALLVVPAFPALEAWAEGHGVTWSSREELVRDPSVVSGVADELAPMFGSLASYERPKRVALLAEEFTIENGFLTPKLSVKRHEVHERLADVIDGLYEQEASDATGP